MGLNIPMTTKTLQTQHHFEESGWRLLHRVHAAGASPNGMNPFLKSNKQEELFVI